MDRSGHLKTDPIIDENNFCKRNISYGLNNLVALESGDEIKINDRSAVIVAPETPRLHRNEGDETVEMRAISKLSDGMDTTKIDDFWEASDQARQTR